MVRLSTIYLDLAPAKSYGIVVPQELPNLGNLCRRLL
jgi:hypothetical protein